MVNQKGFSINFDKNTIDHLGIKLYSSFPPVIAELISNSYDADAENVDVEIDYITKSVKVIDDGHGMTHDELNNSFLVIGRNRREQTKNGLSKNKKRKVTGKKGLGKLAVFGIAKIIEVYSVCEGIENAFSINYDKLKATENGKYFPETLIEYETTNKPNGTTVIIKEIKQKNITSISELAISLSSRFSFFDSDFIVNIKNKNNQEDFELVTKSLYFEALEKEFIWEFPRDFEDLIEKDANVKFLKEKDVTGEIFTKSTPLKSSECGFLLYARKKLASEHVFFNDRSNDRFNSYATGYFNIDFIDDSNDKDLISTARQSILWDEEEDVHKLKIGLDALTKKVENEWRKKRKEKKEEALEEIIPEDFFEGLSPVEKSSLNKVKDALLKNSVDTKDVQPVIKVLDSMKSMYKFESFQEYVETLQEDELTLENVNKIANDWEAIEIKELAKVAVGRIKAITQFEKYVNENASESKVIQPFLEKFPWILDPRITTFEREKTFRKILTENFPDEDLEEKNRRLDFLCNAVNDELIIIELKRPAIKISLKEVLQARRYERFILEKYKSSYGKKVTTFLISDNYNMNDETEDMVESLEKDGKLYVRSYSELLAKAKQYNEEFISKYEEISEIQNENMQIEI
ncbi:ATP-binding protein [Enterococcus faecalis]|nr:ATP-binding protein [Enterococcus faecalis]HAP4881131.1 ATP-binding protein [Enterococcus faecalis]HCY9412701.1 ATP-binding protein [Enterococcus faecalis]